jgi:hypothetical protein
MKMIDSWLQLSLIPIFGVGGLTLLLRAWLISTTMAVRVIMTSVAILGLTMLWLAQ